MESCRNPARTFAPCLFNKISLAFRLWTRQQTKGVIIITLLHKNLETKSSADSKSSGQHRAALLTERRYRNYAAMARAMARPARGRWPRDAPRRSVGHRLTRRARPHRQHAPPPNPRGGGRELSGEGGAICTVTRFRT